MIDKQIILKEVAKEDKVVFARILDKVYLFLKTFQPCFTEFLDPYKISQLLKFIEHKIDCNIFVFGGIDEAERCKIGFFPEYIKSQKEYFPISAILVQYNRKYSKKLSHRDFLGSVIGLGIDRNRIGDIIVNDNNAIIIVDSDISEFISFNLEKVSHTKVNCKIININDINNSKKDFEEKNITVASLRLDAVLSSVFNISRNRAAELIKAEKAFINWNTAESISKNISEGDIITIRGIGRVKIIKLLGKTKKDRFLICVLRFV